MKKILTLILVFCSFIIASDNNISEKELRTKKAIQEALEQEKKFAREQKFYDKNSYDFKGAEVNEESLETVPEMKPQYDFDMTHVYD